AYVCRRESPAPTRSAHGRDRSCRRGSGATGRRRRCTRSTRRQGRRLSSRMTMELANVFTIACDAELEHEGFRIQQAAIAKRIGAELLAGNVYDVAPGKKLWPYHLHHANEEWLVVLRGRPTLRTPEGERELSEGDVACFVRGRAGAHQVRNATEEP